MIYNSLIYAPYKLLNCNMGFKLSQCRVIAKKVVRVFNFTSPVAHTEFKKDNQLMLTDLYTFHLLKLCYKLYRNKLSSYFKNFIYNMVHIINLTK